MTSNDTPDRPAGPASPRPPDAQLTRKAGIVGLATGVSRVLGLVREQTVAFLFGAGFETDCFNVAFRIPNLLRDLFAEGALSAAFVPTFTRLLTTRSRKRAFLLGRRVMAALLVIVGPLVLMGIVFAPTLVHLIAPGLWATPGKGELTVVLTRIMLPFLLLVALAAQAMGMLNALDYFGLPALAPTMLNLGMIVVGTGLALAAPHLGIPPVVGLALGVMAGGLGQLLVQVPTLVREGFGLRPTLSFRDPGVRRILALMTPAAIGQAATQINILVNTQLASYLVEGSISWLNYAFRLMQLPIGMFGVSVAQVTLPAVSRHHSLKDHAATRDAVARAVRLVLALTVPASVGLALLSGPIVALLYQYRRFTPEDTVQTAAALFFYSIGLTGFSVVKVLAQVFYALRETCLPVYASFASVTVNIVANLLLMGPMGHRGLALATSLTGLLNMILLWIPLSRRLGGLADRATVRSLAGVLAASSVMGVVLVLVRDEMVARLGAVLLASRLAVVLVPTAVGVAVFFLVARLAGVEEVREIVSMVVRRVKRR